MFSGAYKAGFQGLAALTCAGLVSCSRPAASPELATARQSLAPAVLAEQSLCAAGYGRAMGHQTQPAIAGTASLQLVVWEDDRSGVGYDVFAERLDASGANLEPAGIPISIVAGNQRRPAVTWDGTNFVVAWTDEALGPSILAVRVSSDGAILDAPPVLVAPVVASTAAARVALASDASGRTLAVWGSAGAGQDLRAAVLSNEAAGLVAGAPFEVSTATGAQHSAAVASCGSGWLATWIDGRGGADTAVYGARIDPTGSALDAPGIALDGFSTVMDPTVACGNGRYVAGWARKGATTDLYLRRVGTDGSLLEAAPVSLATGGDHPRLAFTGDGAGLAVWRQIATTTIWSAQLTDGPALTPAAPVLVYDSKINYEPSGAPSVAALGTGWRVVWQYTLPSAGWDVLQAPVSATGVVGSRSIVSVAARPQTNPAGAFDGTNYLVVFRDDAVPAGAPGYLGARLGPATGALDPSCRAMSSPNFSFDAPAVAFGAGTYLMAWGDEGSGGALMGRTMLPDGTFTSGLHQLANSAYVFKPAVDFDGTDFVVLWSKNDYLWASRIGAAAGAVLDWAAPLQPVPLTTAQDQGALAFDGTNHLLAWHDTRAGHEVYAARMAKDGTVLDAGGKLLASAVGTAPTPAVGHGQGTFLVAWRQDSGANASIVAARVAGDGTVLDPSGIVLASGAGVRKNPSVAFDGQQFVVAWEDASAGNGDLRAARISLAGEVLDPAGFALADGPAPQQRPRLVAGPPGEVLALYMRYDARPAVAAWQTGARRIVAGTPNGTPCTGDGECASGHCVAAVCCDSPCQGACEACTAALGASADGTCTPRSATTVCRDSAGVCDPEERCDGASGQCPADARRAAGTECRASSGACDVAERCDGATVQCPADAVLASGAECRTAAGSCDLPERCDGAAKACPADALRPADAECRPAADACDQAERCDGASAQCPADALRPSGTECRAAAGGCDEAERCDGAAAHCPADLRRSSGTECRAAAGVCDLAERCDGASVDCPADAPRPDAEPCGEGTCWSGTCLSALEIAGTPGPARCRQEFLFVPTVAVAGVTWSLLEGPAGATLDAQTGVVRWTPRPEQTGRQALRLRAQAGPLSDEAAWTLEASCPGVAFEVGCGCSAGTHPGAAGLLGALALLGLPLRRGRVRPDR